MAEMSQSRYDEAYFAWQLAHGGADMHVPAIFWIYAEHIGEPETVIDFGCAGGHLLDAIPARVKLGVEINPVSRAYAQRKGYEVRASLAEFPDALADLIVSNHALEHVPDPFDTLRLMRAKLKPGGRLVLVAPCERYDTRYVERNQDQHLYTWSPMNLGNLVRHAGLDVVSCERIAFRFPPRATLVWKYAGPRLFHTLSRLCGHLFPKLTQVRVVARKPGPGAL